MAVLALGCDRSSPVTPTQPAPPTVAGLAITGADSVLTRVSETYTATVTLTDGSTRTVTPVWSSSSPEIAAVNGNGSLEGRAHGSTTLTATFEGRSASKSVRVVNNYSGTWEGRFVIRACQATGDLSDRDGGYCLAGFGRPGTTIGIRLRIVQSGRDSSDVSVTYPGYDGELKGKVGADGRLTLSGLLSLPDFDYPWITFDTFQVDQWNTTVDGTNGMTGRWSVLYTSLAVRLGTAQMDNELVEMTRR